MTARQHLDLVGLFYVIYGGIGFAFGALMAGLLVFAAIGTAFGAAADSDVTVASLAITYASMAVVVGLFVTVYALPFVIVGLGMRRQKSWSWLSGLVLAVFALMNVPLGTVLGIWWIVKLVDPEVRTLLGRPPPDELA